MANQLINSESLYLKQHSKDPINWLPFTEENIKKAKESQRPCLISIGYSGSHWCHVMKEETFSDDSVAEFINNKLTAFKIDKEEFPEVDLFTRMQVT